MHRPVAAVCVSWASGNHAKNYVPLHVHETLQKWDSEHPWALILAHSFSRRPSIFRKLAFISSRQSIILLNSPPVNLRVDVRMCQP